MLTNSPRRDYKVTAWSCFSDEKKKEKSWYIAKIEKSVQKKDSHSS